MLPRSSAIFILRPCVLGGGKDTPRRVSHSDPIPSGKSVISSWAGGFREEQPKIPFLEVWASGMLLWPFCKHPLSGSWAGDFHHQGHSCAHTGKSLTLEKFEVCGIFKKVLEISQLEGLVHT